SADIRPGPAPALGSCQVHPGDRDRRRLGPPYCERVADRRLGSKSRTQIEKGPGRSPGPARLAPKPSQSTALHCSLPRALPPPKLPRPCSSQPRHPALGPEQQRRTAEQHKPPETTNPCGFYGWLTLTACERPPPVAALTVNKTDEPALRQCPSDLSMAGKLPPIFGIYRTVGQRQKAKTTPTILFFVENKKTTKMVFVKHK